MCGIVGVLSHSSGPDEVSTITSSMLATIVHRGPDAEGIWTEREYGLALGHRRLSILDLSPAGAQPMLSQSGRYALTYNGEIYNHLSVRAAMSHRRISWRGSSDTETLLAAIEHLGLEAALESVTGMFAFALWDRQERKLFLVRDRFGEKPLYYAKLGTSFVFASDLAAIETFPHFNSDINPTSVTHYLSYGWMPQSDTVWASVDKVPPGCVLSVDHKLDTHTSRYWNCAREISESYRSRESLTLGEATDLIDDALTNIVKDQMHADVPLGAWLSGGVDSSVIVALMQKQSTRRIHTFSIGFSEDDYDEARYARAVAKHLGTEHTEVEFSPRDAIDLIPDLSRVFSEPLSDVSQLPTILLSKMTRNDVTVVLTGDGADEVFGGYNRHVAAQDFVRLRRLWFGAGKHLMKFAAGLPPGLLETLAEAGGYNTIQFEEKHRKMLALLQATTLAELYATVVGHGNVDLTGASSVHENYRSPELEPPSMLDPAHHFMYLDTCGYLPDDVLVKVDRSSMNASLETRAPFLDSRLFKLAWSLKPEFKVHRLANKVVLRELLRRYLPSSLIDRPKQGFSLPIGRWLQGPLHEWAEEMLRKEQIASFDLFDVNEVRSAWESLRGGDFRFSNVVWGHLLFQSWADSRGLR